MPGQTGLRQDTPRMLALPLGSRRNRRLAAILHAWMLLAFLVGVVGSSMGQVKSHGVAALGTLKHGSYCCSGDGPSHAHDEEGLPVIGEEAGHPHHSEDHSHDRVHALPPRLALGLPDLFRWQAAAGDWAALLTAFRLERPPRA